MVHQPWQYSALRQGSQQTRERSPIGNAKLVFFLQPNASRCQSCGFLATGNITAIDFFSHLKVKSRTKLGNLKKIT